MKCLSVRQPWASLIVAGLKPVENRSWPTKYRGPLLIHAATHQGQGKFKSDYNVAVSINSADTLSLLGPLKYWLRTYGKGGSVKAEPRNSNRFGAIIGQVNLVDCVQNHPSPWAEQGAWHWVLADAKAFDVPVPYPGRLGLFDAPDPDADHLFRPHDGKTRRVCITEEPCDVMITRPGKWGNPFRVKKYDGLWAIERWDKHFKDWFDLNHKYPNPIGPYINKIGALENCLKAYKSWLRLQRKEIARLPSLKGLRLGCFCRPGEPCHGDVLVRLVEENT